MEKTTEEKARAKLLKFGKKNRWNRAVAVSLLFFCDAFFFVSVIIARIMENVLS